jgi:ribosomal protein S18 acetylase RimI-like enzyme
MMSDVTPIDLLAALIVLDSPEFAEICRWPFEDAYVGRVLRNDIRRRMHRGACRIWGYFNLGRQLVGFGTLDVCGDYSDFTDGRLHPYIPLLAVNPAMQGKGYGSYIVRHLIDFAAISAIEEGRFHDALFLDVYKDNERAIGLYKKLGFQIVEDDPRPDPDENGRPYFIMARRVSVMPAEDRD